MVQFLLCTEPKLQQQANVLAERLSLLSRSDSSDFTDDELVLFLDDSGIGLCTYGKGKRRSTLQVNFVAGKANHRRLFGGNASSDLVRAIGKENKRVLDATAGLGQDSFALASVGFAVTLCERNPIVRTLLQDGIRRASGTNKLQEIMERMKFLPDDSFSILTQLGDERLQDNRPDVVYLDPMYPERSKSALVKKEMRWLKDIVGNDEDADDLLPLAKQAAKNRVVVKRMLKAPPLANEKPGHSIRGRTTRFDVYV